MTFDLETYKRITGSLDTNGIDFDAFRDQPLAPEHLRCLRYARRRAAHVVLPAEPAEHESAPRVAAMRRRLGWRITGSPVVWMAFPAATRHFLAVHMTFGAINEWTTQGGYARLAQVSGHPVLAELLRRIMPVEHTRHLVRTLFDGPDGRAVADRIDRRVDRLPGLDGLGLMERSLTQYAA